MKTKTSILSLVVLALLVSHVNAQNILQAYLQEGLKSNLQFQQEGLQFEKSVQGLNAARALFMPQVGINASYTLANGGRKIQFPVGDLLNPVYTTLNQLTDSQNFPQINNETIQFLPNHFHDTKLRVIQPLFNPDIYFNYKAQKELVNVQQAQKNVYENELKYSIAAGYYQYLQSEEALKVLAQTKTTLQELVRTNQKLVANQKATRDVVLSAEYELNKIEQQLTEAEKNREVAQAYFNFLLNRDLNEHILVDTALLASTYEQHPLDELTNNALNQRQELKQVQGGLTATGSLVALNKSTALLPKINVVGDIGYQGFEYKFDNDQQYWLVQFSLSWDLFKGGERRARTQQARIDYQVAENKMDQLKKQIELQVIQTYHECAAAKQSFVTAQSGVKSAEKNFQIVRSKYNEGQALMIEYLDAQNKFTTAQLMQSIRLFDLLRAETQLQKMIANL
jgi:outer membrane protein